MSATVRCMDKQAVKVTGLIDMYLHLRLMQPTSACPEAFHAARLVELYVLDAELA